MHFIFFLQHFIIFNFPLIQASLESANSAGVNGNKSGASRHALAAVSVVHLLAHAKTPSRAAGAVRGQRFSEAAGVPSFVWRDYMVGDLVWEVLFFVSCRMGGQCLDGNEGRGTTVRNKYKK